MNIHKEYRKAFSKQCVNFIYDASVMSRATDYLQAGAKFGTKGLREISLMQSIKEVAQYFNLSPAASYTLCGREAHSNVNESNFGRFSQQDQTG